MDKIGRLALRGGAAEALHAENSLVSNGSFWQVESVSQMRRQG